MFEVDRQAAVRDQLLDRARADARMTGAAVTGSAARGVADRWSDVDLFFGVDNTVEVVDVLADWTTFIYGQLNALHHFDLTGGSATYRAFLLDDGLEIDLGFAPEAHFGPHGTGAFTVVFGTPIAPTPEILPEPGHLIGLAWHHILHARISIERGEPWQAEHWIGALRDVTSTLACVRVGLPPFHGKGTDRLPVDDRDRLEPSLVATLHRRELFRALAAAAAALLAEVDATDPILGARLAPRLLVLASSR